MMYALIGLLAGVLLGFVLPVTYPAAFTLYISVAILAAILAYIGDRLGVPLYYAAIFAFGSRLFQNFAIIRRHLIDKLHEKKAKRDQGQTNSASAGLNRE